MLHNQFTERNPVHGAWSVLALTFALAGCKSAQEKAEAAHASRMTDQHVKDFDADWEVISHQPNTATGFGATLFKLKSGFVDARKGTYEARGGDWRWGRLAVCRRRTPCAC